MREYLLVFLVAAAVTYLLTVLAREIALRTGAVAEVRDRDVHAEPIPYLGGLAMLGGLVAAYAVARELPFLSTQNPFGFADAGAVLLAGGLVCGVGVLDDLFELDALTKLGGQVIAVAFLIYSGIQFIFIPTPTGYQYTIDQAQGALADGPGRHRHHQRGQLRRRPRRPGRRGGRDRGGGVLRLQLPAGQPQRRSRWPPPGRS